MEAIDCSILVSPEVTLHTTAEPGEPKWPIRVGGRYPTCKPDRTAIAGSWCIVTAIDGDTIYFRFEHLIGGILVPTELVYSCSAHTFRATDYPEDASPTSRLYEIIEELTPLVRAARSWHNFHHDSSMVQCDAICDALPAAETALLNARTLKEALTHAH